MIRLLLILALALAPAACGRRDAPPRAAEPPSRAIAGLYPGETPEMRRLIRAAAAEHDIPEALLHRVIQRESDYRADARNGPYWGLMQILPQTARTMGFRGEPRELLDPRVNLRYAGRYLRGAWIVADGSIDRAVMWYARGYYFEARDRCLLVETGLAAREVNRRCR
jgi:soluble lytic murein transglycosylase-like protein